LSSVPALSQLATHQASGSQPDEPKPVPLIFDTDIGNDCDDVMAMGVIHALQSRRECDLLAVTITKDHELAAPFTDVVNTFYGRGNIPIGVCNSGVTPHKGSFNVLAEAEAEDEGRLRYPHDLKSGKDAPPAVEVLRKTLVAAEDNSVVIAQVGFSTNLANLLRSEPDAHSKLDGRSLVEKKVKLLSIMAGAFTKIPGKNGELRDHLEYNVVKDLASARFLADHWPTAVVWSGFEIGLNLKYPYESIAKDFRYVEHHPVAEAYNLYLEPPHNRPTWDLTSVLVAVRPDRGYFDASARGRVSIDEKGLTTFTEQENGRDRYLILRPQLKPRALEALVQLTSQPPIKD
jgi:inosine-uridine nucleoside N-ribohydrolase